MAWQFESGRPIYTQLVDRLRMKIASGAYAPGVKLPAVRAFAADTGVNPNTLQRALQQLEAEGLLFTQSTAGKYVTEDASVILALKHTLAAQLAAQFMADMRAMGLTDEETTQIILNYSKEADHNGNS